MKKSNATGGSHAPGRRLYAQDQYFAPWLKLWLWALVTLPSIVYLDADVLVRQNIDALFSFVGGGSSVALDRYSLAAVPARCPIPGGRNLTAFNTGVLWLRPSLLRLRELQGQASTWYQRMKTGWKPNKACESRVGDQTLLFHAHLRHPPTPLPARFNVAAHRLQHEQQQGAAGATSSMPAASVLHYLGEPKPWAFPAGTRRRELPERLQGPHFELWHRHACPAGDIQSDRLVSLR